METVTIPTPGRISSSDADSVGRLADSLREKAKIKDVDDVTVPEMPPDELEEEFTNVAEEDEQEEEDDDDDYDDYDGDEFSFAFNGFGSTLISADDAFQNGQIRTSFPLSPSVSYRNDHRDDFPPRRPPVQRVFIEADDSISPHPPPSEDISGDGSSGPYSVWSGKAVEAAPEVCEKSNSTGFSKLWRFPKLLKRSSSDGKDAYVFFHGSSSKKDGKTAQAGRPEKIIAKATKSTKAKSAAIKAHEHYLVLRNKEDDRRKSYLPYRPKLVGFFTNFHGGLRRNVVPF